MYRVLVQVLVHVHLERIVPLKLLVADAAHQRLHFVFDHVMLVHPVLHHHFPARLTGNQLLLLWRRHKLLVVLQSHVRPDASGVYATDPTPDQRRSCNFLICGSRLFMLILILGQC